MDKVYITHVRQKINNHLIFPILEEYILIKYLNFIKVTKEARKKIRIKELKEEIKFLIHFA